VVILRDTKVRILRTLGKTTLHGYELAKKLNLPITGIYQHLRDLTDERLIVSHSEGRRKIYSLTKKGEALLGILEGDSK